ncbi:MAG: hypothetical protein JJD92_05915 [Frankiaceae bacterium]|nr:hypothetical protein [Frankiaceae bacterium]
MKRLVVVLSLVGVVAALHPAGAAESPAAPANPVLPVARPDVTGPVTGGLKGRPFMGLLAVPRGFVQEEYFVSGTARPYVGPAVLAKQSLEGTESLAPLPYTTRIIVVRPVTRANGTVVVTWNNVTFGHDINEWSNIGRQVVADRYTYVDASVQLASMPGMKAFDPVRYATVALPGDAYSYDIYSQVAQALLHGDGLHGTRPARVLAIGASQSGFALDQYLSDVQPRYERVYDGFLVAVANGPDHRVDRPVIRLLSENEIDGTSVSPDGRLYRQWEIAGSAHGNKNDFEYIGATEERDLGVDLVNPLAGDNGPFGTSDCLMNRFPTWQAYNGALVALDRWVGGAGPPAPQPRVRVVGGEEVRDPAGNSVGGIRYPAMAVPVAAYNRTGDCVQLDGRTEPFTGQELRRRYPTHAIYVSAVKRAVAAALRAGVLTANDAAETLAGARRAVVPPPA